MPTDAPQGLDYFFRDSNGDPVRVESLSAARKLQDSGHRPITRKQWEEALDEKIGTKTTLLDESSNSQNS